MSRGSFGREVTTRESLGTSSKEVQGILRGSPKNFRGSPRNILEEIRRISWKTEEVRRFLEENRGIPKNSRFFFLSCYLLVKKYIKLATNVNLYDWRPLPVIVLISLDLSIIIYILQERFFF